MKNQISFCIALLFVLSLSLSSCAEKGSGCYYSQIEQVEKDQDSQIKTTLVVQKEDSEISFRTGDAMYI